MRRLVFLALILLPALPALARQPADSLKKPAEKPACCAATQKPSAPKESGERLFSINASMWSRGEFRDGALPAANGADHALFVMSNSVVGFNYADQHLEARFSPKFFGVWGAKGSGGVAVEEAWFGLKHTGLFLRLGRQRLAYDDERIIGDNDWSMAPNTHDLVKTGFESKKHKLHLLLAYNQNNENLNGGSYYVNGAQAYKNMQALWYHWDPLKQLGASLVFMNMGMQDARATEEEQNVTDFQQIFGIFADWHPKNFSLQASYYRQTGFDEHARPIHAWMTSVEAKAQLGQKLTLGTGYFYMSGDAHFTVPGQGSIGLSQKTEVRGFNPMFGSHHEFYGAMDFFYVTTYYGGNTPGLQDLHARAGFTPVKGLGLSATYHYLATGVAIKNAATQTLGHEIELEASWKFLPNATLMAGYSFMNGTETMNLLKRTSDKNHLHWAWLMVVVTPEFFSRRW